MRARGITYDTGFVRNGASSRRRFEPELVERELRVIRDDLHCTAVRVTGGDPERIDVAATFAAGLGLEVWFSPYPLELTTEETLSLFADCAERAERLRRRGGEVVFVFIFALYDHPHRPTASPATTWTWRATASSRSSRTAWATPTPACPGSPRPRSPPSPTATTGPDAARGDDGLRRPASIAWCEA